MRFELAVNSHILVGSAALILYWCALLATKGSRPHRRAGRAFFVTLLIVAASVAPVVFLRPVPFDPGQVVQMVYLSLCLATVTMLGWSAIRLKGSPERFRGRHFKVLGPVLASLGALVLAAGLAKGDPVAAVLSWVGLVYGGAMIHFAWRRAPLRPTWWLSWHLNAVCGLFTAVHGTLLFVAWRWAVDPQATRADAAASHIAVLIVAIGLRTWYGRRRGIPWGASGAARPPVAASA
ncbi:MAG: hypothetical protein R3E83_20930 [Burkholderiaceae bacterium]